MRITRNQLSLLIETFLLLESKRADFDELVANSTISKEDFNTIFKRNGQPSGVFRDNIFRSTVYNTLVAELGHSVTDTIDAYPLFKQMIIDPFNKGQLRAIKIPGTSFGVLDLTRKITGQTATYDDFNLYIETVKTTVIRSKVLQKLLDAGFAGDNSNFEVVYEDNDWIVCYPKTYQGSISVARMGPDKKYYTPPEIGKMTWCTAIDSGSNMFLNYHRKLNLHMYYVTKKSNYSKIDRFRKICVSFAKQKNIVTLAESGNSTVDADNKGINSAELESAIGKSLYNVLYKDAQRPERREVDIAAYYESISLEQYLAQRKVASKMGKNDFALFIREISYYVSYNKNEDIMIAIASDENVSIAIKLANTTTEIPIKAQFILSKHSNERVRMYIADNRKTSPKIINYLIDDESIGVLHNITKRNDLTQQMQTKLSRSVHWDVRVKIARNENTETFVLDYLSNDDHADVRSAVIKNKATLDQTLNFMKNKKRNTKADNFIIGDRLDLDSFIITNDQAIEMIKSGEIDKLTDHMVTRENIMDHWDYSYKFKNRLSSETYMSILLHGVNIYFTPILHDIIDQANAALGEKFINEPLVQFRELRRLLEFNIMNHTKYMNEYSYFIDPDYLNKKDLDKLSMYTAGDRNYEAYSTAGSVDSGVALANKHLIPKGFIVASYSDIDNEKIVMSDNDPNGEFVWHKSFVMKY